MKAFLIALKAERGRPPRRRVRPARRAGRTSWYWWLG